MRILRFVRSCSPPLLLLAGLLLLPGLAPAASWPWTVRILGNSDSRAELHPCLCSNPPLGGLALRSAIVKRLRLGSAGLVLVDGGDFTPAPEETLGAERTAFELEVMPLLGYDAVAVGELDLLPGLDALRRAAAALPLVCANLEAPGVDIPPVRWVDLEGHRVAITSFLDPVLFYEQPGALAIDPDSLLVSDPAAGLAEALASVAPSADLVVVLAHASEDLLEEVLPPDAGVDVVLLGHEHVRSRTLEREPALLLRPGERSRSLADLRITFLGPDEPEQVDYKLWDLKRETRTDANIEEMIQRFEANPGGS